MAHTLFKLFLTQRLAVLASTESLRAIREGLLWILPCLLVSAGFLILSECALALGFDPQVVSFLAGLHKQISSVIPLLVAASIGYMWRFNTVCHSCRSRFCAWPMWWSPPSCCVITHVLRPRFYCLLPLLRP